MPNLPDVSSLGARPIPRSQRSIARVDMGAESRAMQQLGTTVENNAQKALEKIDKTQYAHARSRFLRESIRASSDLDNDPDYSTYEARYTERMAKARAEAEGVISNGSQRDLFTADVDADIERGLASIRQKAQAKESDYGRASLADTLQQNMDSVLRSKDESSRLAVLDTSNTAIQSAQARGYLTAEGAQKARSEFSATYALGRLSGMSTEEQANLLKQEQSKGGTFAEFIPAEKRAAMLESVNKQLEEKTYRQVAQNKSDDIINKYPEDYKAQITEANKIEDAQVRSKVVSSLDDLYARTKRMKDADKETRNDKAVNIVLEGGTLADIPVKDYLDMEESDRKALEKIQRKRDNLEPSDDIKALETYDEVARTYSKNPKSILNYSLPELRANIPTDKIDKVLEWRQKASEGGAPEVIRGQVTDVIDDSLGIMGIKTGQKASKADKQRSALFREKLETGIQAYVEKNGKQPTYTEVTGMRDQLIQKITFDGWGNSDKYKFEISPDTDLTKIEVPENVREKILLKVQQRNPDLALTEEQIKQIYIKMIE